MASPPLRTASWALSGHTITQYTSATAIALSGRRIGLISGGNAYAKEGDYTNQGWQLIGNGFSQIALDGDELSLPATPSRIGLLSPTGAFFVREGGLLGQAYLVATNITSIAVGAGWIGAVDINNKAWAKAGVNDGWTLQANNAQSIALGGAGANRRLGVIADGNASVKEGSLGAGWYPQWTGATKVTVNSGRVGVVTTSGQARVREGELASNPPWVIVATGVSDLRLN